MQKHIHPEKSLERQAEIKVGTVEKITAFMGGFFLSPLLIAIMLKVIPNFWGAFAGCLLALGLGFYSLKKYQKPLPKIVALGMMGSTALLIVGTVITWIFITIAFQGISK